MLGAYYPGQAYPAQAPDYPPVPLGPPLDLCEATAYAIAPIRTVRSLMPARGADALTDRRTASSLMPERGAYGLTPSRSNTPFCDED